MKTNQIRKQFLDYFAAREHAIVPGSSLVPHGDATLLFTNSGMVQFKDIFLGAQPAATPRAVTAQRCVRAGGKHNDLENVGYTARHHTFFEMLGNFSFGDYFKREAIGYAWELLTEHFHLPADKLWVTVYEDDDEAAQLWRKEIGVPAARISRIGARDNFWAMGDTGPCGPCSEIFYDHGDAVAGGPPGTPESEGDRFVEVWNLVFMQYERDAAGKLTPLPKPSVDTGMGLERIAAILQGVHSNYDIDLFQNLMSAAAEVLSVAKPADDSPTAQSLRVIADHIRSTAFLIADGVTPSNEGRGYVLRRIIRRAVRHGYQLGCRESFMHKLVAPLVAEMGEASAELSAAADEVAKVLRRENEKFAETLEQGLKILAREMSALGDGKTVPGEVAFRLYDTYGFPLDLTADIARERGVGVDTAGFDAAMEGQRNRARAASQFGGSDGDKKVQLIGVKATRFCGYDSLQNDGQVIALINDARDSCDELKEGQRGAIVLDATTFYAESGGQVGDTGTIFIGDKTEFMVDDTQYIGDKIIAHFGAVATGNLRLGDNAKTKVAAELRNHCANNHSATHLLHAALKSVLGEHVQQKGSLVDAQKLRFDFAHHSAVSGDEIRAIEQLVNRQIRANLAREVATMNLDEAKKSGAEALFGEKYDAQVRVVNFAAFSTELCGGTHVERSGDIGLFKVTSESGIAAGVRRVEAVTGASAEQWIADRLSVLDDAAAALKTPPAQVTEKIKTLINQSREQQKQLQSLQTKLAGGGNDDIIKTIAGVKVAALRLDADVKTMRLSVDQWKQKLGDGIVLVVGVSDGKVTLIAGVTNNMTEQFHAGKLIETLAKIVDGRGGGKPELAQGGGAKVDAVDAVFDALYSWVGEQ